MSINLLVTFITAKHAGWREVGWAVVITRNGEHSFVYSQSTADGQFDKEQALEIAQKIAKGLGCSLQTLTFEPWPHKIWDEQEAIEAIKQSQHTEKDA